MKRTSELLKKFCEEKNVKQKEIVEVTGLTSAGVSKAFTGKIRFKEKNLETVLEYLKLSNDEKLEVWKAWTLDGGEEKAAAYFEKLDKENKKLKKIIENIKLIAESIVDD